MLNLSGPLSASALTPWPCAISPTQQERPDDERRRSTQVWPLHSPWPVIIDAVLALGPVIVRAGDGLCSVEHRAHLRWLGSIGKDGLVLPGASLSIDTASWALGVATQATLNDGQVQRGFTFFDGHGRAVLKLDLAAGASPHGFHQVVRRFALAAPPSRQQDAQALFAWPAAQGRLGAIGLLRRLQVQRNDDGLLDRLGDQDLAQPLPSDALLEVLHQTRQFQLPMSALFVCRGLQLTWNGVLHQLDGRCGVAQASGLDIELQWSETYPGPQAWLIREPTSSGLSLSLALLGPDGELRLLLAPLHGPAQPQPCAWQSAINTACGERCGTAC